VSLIGAIFVLLVLAALAGWLVTVTGVQHATTLHGVLGTRAHFGARAGLEWAIHDIVNAAGAGLDCAPGSTTFGLAGGALDGFQVEVACSAQTVTEGAGTFQLYQLESSATHGVPGSLDHASRTLIATVAQ
jgi:MSHA biogenesis protein MshP